MTGLSIATLQSHQSLWVLPVICWPYLNVSIDLSRCEAAQPGQFVPQRSA
jgi:hypothetical protein